MKLLANIWFESLHRKVQDKVCIHHTLRHHGNQLTKIDLIRNDVYNYLAPLFYGWRFSLRINLWWVKKYQRYEPKRLDLLQYEYERLSTWNKCVYRIRKKYAA